MESISNILERLRVGELMPRTSASSKVGIMPGPADAEVEVADNTTRLQSAPKETKASRQSKKGRVECQ
eukprot:scaffold695_cov279-Chaetoceros_neogracile.AAC.19